MRQVLGILIVLLFITAGCKKDKQASVATLTTAAVTGITANTAQTGGNITNDGGSSISKRGICWATHSAPTVADSITSDGTGTGSFTSSLSNLASYTTYYVRSYAINATGTSYGNELSFTTSTGAPSVTTTAVSNIVPLSAKSGGNITSDGGSPVTARGVCWSTSVHPTVNNFKTSDSVGKGMFTSTLTPLASQATYYARAYATNAFGTAYGNEVSFTSSSADAVTDIDGNVYPYVTIGTQTWLTANLKTTHYRNGDSIVNGSINNWYTNAQAWYNTATVGAYSFPNNDPNNNNTYGKYYDNLAVNDSRGMCPIGWHIPSDDEWNTLEIYEGMSATDAAKHDDFYGTIGGKLLEGGSSGLNLQLAGYLYLDNQAGPTYLLFGDGGAGFYWSSTSFQTGTLPTAIANWYRAFNLSGTPGPVYRSYAPGYGMPVRCVKD